MLENENYATHLRRTVRRPVPGADAARRGRAARELLRDRPREQRQLHLDRLRASRRTRENQADCQVFDDFIAATSTAERRRAGVGCVYPADVQNIGTQLTAAKLTWKAYDAGHGQRPQPRDRRVRAPGAERQDETQDAVEGDGYATRHDPFVYFHSVIDNQTYCDAHVVALGSPDRRDAGRRRCAARPGLATDLKKVSTTPNFSFITPNLCDDGHDYPCTNQPSGASALADIDAFLETWVPKITSSPAFKQERPARDHLRRVRRTAVGRLLLLRRDSRARPRRCPGITGPGRRPRRRGPALAVHQARDGQHDRPTTTTPRWRASRRSSACRAWPTRRPCRPPSARTCSRVGRAR